MIENKKVLILYNNLFHYRIPIFNLLAEKCDLTVGFSLGSNTNEDCKFKIIQLPIIKINRFVLHKDNIYKLCENFDVVIAYGDIAWLSFSTLTLYKNKSFKIIYWSPGVSASYDKKFDTVKRWDRIRDFFYKKADALIFYTDYPIRKYLNRGFLEEKLFVAPNTVEVCKSLEVKGKTKDSILFIGTLYMQKGILTLLENYKAAFEVNPNILPLNIIGGGIEFEKVNNWIVENNLDKKILLRGSIFNIVEKYFYFEKAFACISPVQAGLSVLESMGCGVAFVTMNNSITGGERLNIKNGFNGVLLENTDQLKSVILDITKNSEKYAKMGKNGLEYYNNSHKPQDMANGLYSAIKFVSK
ncbi:putative glycosyltransferase [Polaribacter irgensii 23-P]|uniref:Putative glycosyltransferase n=1 Tax=Polaribacter irgensii 23-P TaxID=313594 RepID=A4BYM7_9FLAO|nr:glycosyltransferase family 4 protein [Polaribacter irgensii]EAR12270.1 putative glycosyltransferase [Polaribacter irgensii 23-P]